MYVCMYVYNGLCVYVNVMCVCVCMRACVRVRACRDRGVRKKTN